MMPMQRCARLSSIGALTFFRAYWCSVLSCSLCSICPCCALELILDFPQEKIVVADLPAASIDIRFRAFVDNSEGDLAAWNLGVSMQRHSSDTHRELSPTLSATILNLKELRQDACYLLSSQAQPEESTAERVYECFANWPLLAPSPDPSDTSNKPKPTDSDESAQYTGHWRLAVMACKEGDRCLPGIMALVEVSSDQAESMKLPAQLLGMRGTQEADDELMWVPTCYLEGEPLSRQTSDCRWLLLAFDPFRELYYTKEEYALAIETVNPDRLDIQPGLNVDHVHAALPARSRQTRHIRTSGSQHDSCAVVGNSWILLEDQMGQEIDAHEAVFRINAAPLDKEFAPFVGQKCTHRVLELSSSLSAGVPWAYNDFVGEVQLLRLTPSTGDAVNQVLWAYGQRRGRFGQDRIKVISRAFVDYVHVHFLEDYERGSNLTTGIVAVMLALHSCKTVSTYGFGGGFEVRVGRDSSVTARYNYWSEHSDKESNIVYPFHPWDEEDALHTRLHKAGALTRRFPRDLQHAWLNPGTQDGGIDRAVNQAASAAQAQAPAQAEAGMGPHKVVRKMFPDWCSSSVGSCKLSALINRTRVRTRRTDANKAVNRQQGSSQSSAHTRRTDANKAVVLNWTAKTELHFGPHAVCYLLDTALAHAGWHVLARFPVRTWPSDSGWMDAVSESDVVIVNAEGSLHSNRHNVHLWILPLLYSIGNASLVLGKPVHVINMGLYPDLSHPLHVSFYRRSLSAASSIRVRDHYSLANTHALSIHPQPLVSRPSDDVIASAQHRLSPVVTDLMSVDVAADLAFLTPPPAPGACEHAGVTRLSMPVMPARREFRGTHESMQLGGFNETGPTGTDVLRTRASSKDGSEEEEESKETSDPKSTKPLHVVVALSVSRGMGLDGGDRDVDLISRVVSRLAADLDETHPNPSDTCLHLVLLFSHQGLRERLESLPRVHVSDERQIGQVHRLPSCALGLFLHADLVITGRYHAGVFSALAGKPTIVLPSNTLKNVGLVAEVNSPLLRYIHVPTDVVDALELQRFADMIWKESKALLVAHRDPRVRHRHAQRVEYMRQRAATNLDFLGVRACGADDMQGGARGMASAHVKVLLPVY